MAASGSSATQERARERHSVTRKDTRRAGSLYQGGSGSEKPSEGGTRGRSLPGASTGQNGELDHDGA